MMPDTYVRTYVRIRLYVFDRTKQHCTLTANDLSPALTGASHDHSGSDAQAQVARPLSARAFHVSPLFSLTFNLVSVSDPPAAGSKGDKSVCKGLLNSYQMCRQQHRPPSTASPVRSPLS
jgi:hypothetical protein